MRVSIIIPSYNRAELLKETLGCLAQQHQVDPDQFEVIVVDDGSAENLEEVAAAFRNQILNLYYVYRPRDEYSSRARARNLGVSRCKGEIITFLDCGIVIQNDFLFQLIKLYNHPLANSQIIYHYVLGMGINSDIDDISITAQLQPSELKQVISQLFDIPQWTDRREGVFEAHGYNLNHMAAPWCIGWTAAYSVASQLFKDAGGFDESFLGWGAEDTDLSLRLHKLGAIIHANRDTAVLHLPHPESSETYDEKTVSNARNEMKLHQKNYQFDTELYLFYPAPYYSFILDKHHRLVLQYIVPKYKSQLIESINSRIGTNMTNLLIGSDSRPLIKSMKVTDIFIQNPQLQLHLQQLYQHKRIHYMLGANTPFADRYFDTIVITDFLRILGRKIITAMMIELSRISKQLLFIYTDSYVPPAVSIHEEPWVELKELEEILSDLGLELHLAEEIDSHRIFTIVQGGLVECHNYL